MAFFPLWPILQLVNLGIFILVIVGIIRVVHGQEKPLPIVGSWSKYFDKI